MNNISEFFQWFERRPDLAYVTIRVYLGIALCVRGVLLMSDPSAITVLAGAEKVFMWYSYIFSAHMIGGLLLAIGLLTRFMAFLQLPILVGAVFFLHLKQGLLTVGQSLELSALVLVLLLIYFLFGAGGYSLDHYFAGRKSTATAQ